MLVVASKGTELSEAGILNEISFIGMSWSELLLFTIRKYAICSVDSSVGIKPVHSFPLMEYSVERLSVRDAGRIPVVTSLIALKKMPVYSPGFSVTALSPDSLVTFSSA